MTQVYIDVSYTGTGICVVDLSFKRVQFHLLSQAQTKRAFINYFDSASKIRDSMSKFLNTLLKQVSPKELVLIQEAPFPNGMSSAGLFGLQFLLIDLYKSLHLTVKMLPPSFVSNAVKKFMNVNKESTSIRKQACEKNKLVLEQHGYQFTNPLELKKAGADVATAMLFWTETVRQQRDWPTVLQDGVVVLQDITPQVKKNSKARKLR